MCSVAWVVVVVVVVVVLGVVVGVEVQVDLRSSFVLQPKLCVLSNPLRSHILASGKLSGKGSAPSSGTIGCHLKLLKTSKLPPLPNPSIRGSPWCPLLLTSPLLPFLLLFGEDCARAWGAVVMSATAVVQTSCASALENSPLKSLRSASTTAASPGVHLPRRPST